MVTADPSSLTELVAMGFTHQQAKEALERCNNDKEQAINWIFSRADMTAPDDVMLKEDDEISKVLAISMQETSSSSVYVFDPISPEERVRTPGVPVGLKNVGNTCYFNSLLQAYFMIPEFVKEILTFKEPVGLNSDNSQQSRLQSASLKLVKQLQRLFCSMIRSHRRYVDPSSVLNALVDDFGNTLMIGDQKDVGEFNMVFVSRIEDGMKPIKPEEEDRQEGNARPPEDKPEVQLVRKGSINYSFSIPDEGVVSSLFYGRQVELLSSKEEDGGRVFQHQEAIFGQVMLDVDERDIYSAWDKSCYSQIEGYVTPLNFKTSAEQEVWLTRLPKVLLFQIQRVYYDKETSSSIKKHTIFNIEKVLYPDRFMHQNRALGSTLRKQAQELKQKVSALESTLSMYERYANDSLNLEKVLRHASYFVGEQIDLRNQEDADFMCAQVTQEQLAETQSILNTYAEQVSYKVRTIKADLAELDAAIKAVFDLDELKQNSYRLHSILVHDGMAGSGHYYAYIHDIEQDRWRKYSDISVTDVSEQEVFERSIGGYSMTSAYCLMYVAASLDAYAAGHPLRTYAFVEDPELIPDVYTSLLPFELRRETDDDNQRLKRELEDYRSNQVIKLIQDTYVSRFMTANSILVSYRGMPATTSEGNRFLLMNFPIYLKIKYEERLSRYEMLSQVCKEILHQSISEMDKSGPIYNKVSGKLLKSHKDMPYNIEVTPYEVQRIEKMSQEFMQNLKDAHYCVVLFKYFLNEDFETSYAILKAEFTRNLIDSATFQKPPRELAKVGSYFLMTAVSANAYSGNIERAQAYANILVPWVTELYNSYDINYKQVAASFKLVNKAVAQSNSPLKEDFEFKYRQLEIATRSRFEGVLPQDYHEVLETISNYSPRSWVEGWKSDSLASHYHDLYQAFKVKYSKWYDLNTRISSNRRLLTERELLEFEQKVAQVHLN